MSKNDLAAKFVVWKNGCKQNCLHLSVKARKWLNVNMHIGMACDGKCSFCFLSGGWDLFLRNFVRHSCPSRATGNREFSGFGFNRFVDFSPSFSAGRFGGSPVNGDQWCKGFFGGPEMPRISSDLGKSVTD